MGVVVQKSESALKTFRLLSNLTIKNIIKYLKENGPSPPSRIARGTGISPSTASRCLQEMRSFNIVKARWETKSVDERPLKVYTLVPNVLRFEFVLNEPKVKALRAKHSVRFLGNGLVDFKEDDKKYAYVSLGEAPFRFEGSTAEVLKEVSRNSYTIEELKNKFEDHPELEKDLKHLLTLGIIDIGMSAHR